MSDVVAFVKHWRWLPECLFSKCTQFADIHRAAVGGQRQRRATNINTIECRGGGIQIRRATPDAPFMIGNQRQVGTVTIERGELPREVRVDINDQIAAGAKSLQLQAV